MKVLHIFFCLFSALTILSCHKSNDPSLMDIQPVFKPFWDKFLQEGQKRGISFSTDQQAISIRIVGGLRKLGYTGQANYETRTIIIDSIWLSSTDEEKQLLLFHELGHLMLNRSHVFRYLANGEVESLMWTTENNLDKCSWPIFRGSLRQTYYLDELFKPQITQPNWALEKLPWSDSNQKSGIPIVGEMDWNDNQSLQTLTKTSPDQISYNIRQGMFQLKVDKQTQNSGFKLPVNTLFPILDNTLLKNYEVRMRYKLYGRGFELGWAPSNAVGIGYFISSNYCPSQTNLGVGIGSFPYFYTDKIKQLSNDWNELVLRHKDNYVSIWLNQQLLFQSDVPPTITESPLALKLYFGPGQYDFEFISVTRL